MQDFDFIVLLSKRFSGEISSAESAILDAWIAQSQQNAQLAEQYHAAWSKSSQAPKTFKIDLDSEYRRLQARLPIAEQPVGRVIPLGRQILRIAAALAFLVLAVWGYRQLVPATPAMLVEQAIQQEKRLLTLPDGSRVWLRENARLEYPAQFNTQERQVKLTGEAYFEVAHLKEKPFRVSLADGGLVEVLGTRFNIQIADQTSVLVRDGKVRYAPDGQTAGSVLIKGDKAVFNKKSNQLLLSKVASFNELSWQTGGLEFVRTPLRDVLKDLEAYYKVSIELRNPALLSCLYTAPLTNQSIEEVLEALSLVYTLSVSKPAPARFVLSNGRCQ